MTWTCNLSRTAAKQFQRLPRNQQVQVRRAIDQLGDDPFAGDVVPVKSGSFQGALRKRVGRYRVIFFLNEAVKLVEVAAILPRTEKTYD